jgi:hypothetical protein
VSRKPETPGGETWSQPQWYEIRFKGYLSSYRAQVFEGLEMVQRPDGETVLTGPVVDQAALHGILSKIRDLGVPLLSVKRLSADERNADQAAHADGDHDRA